MSSVIEQADGEASPSGLLGGWSARRWATAAVAAVLVALVIGLPTDVIPNPLPG